MFGCPYWNWHMGWMKEIHRRIRIDLLFMEWDSRSAQCDPTNSLFIIRMKCFDMTFKHLIMWRGYRPSPFVPKRNVWHSHHTIPCLMLICPFFVIEWINTEKPTKINISVMPEYLQPYDVMNNAKTSMPLKYFILNI